MVGTFTSLQLIRYIYHDCSSTESQILEECLSTDISAQEELNELRDASWALPKALFSAHPNSIENILEYSRNFKI
jgi:hypothetical protein